MGWLKITGIILAFLLVTLPGSIDAWLALADRVRGKAEPVTINFGSWSDIYQLIFPLLGLVILVCVVIWGRKTSGRTSSGESAEPTPTTPPVSSKPENALPQPQGRAPPRGRPTLVTLEPGASDARLTNMTGTGDIDMIDNRGAPKMYASNIHLTRPPTEYPKPTEPELVVELSDYRWGSPGGLTLSTNSSGIQVTPRVLLAVITFKAAQPLFVNRMELEIAQQVVVAEYYRPETISGWKSRIVEFKRPHELSKANHNIVIRARTGTQWVVSPVYSVSADML